MALAEAVEDLAAALVGAEARAVAAPEEVGSKSAFRVSRFEA